MNARLLAELRPVGFAVAYRMLGSVSEAEDIVQEAFLRLHHTLQDGKRIEYPAPTWRRWSPDFASTTRSVAWCSASIWSDPDGSRRIVWMIKQGRHARWVEVGKASRY